MSYSTSSHEVSEGNSYVCTMTLLDEAGDPVASAALDTITLTLYDRDTREVINTRDGQDVFDTNGGTMHATSGLFTLLLEPDDLPIVTTRKSIEVHVAHVRFAWTDGTDAKAVSHEFELEVRNIRAFAL